MNFTTCRRNLTRMRRFLICAALIGMSLCAWGEGGEMDRVGDNPFDIEEGLYLYYMKAQRDFHDPKTPLMADTLRARATHLGDQKAVCLSYTIKMDYYGKKADYDEAMAQARQLMNFSIHTPYKQYYFFGWSRIITNLLRFNNIAEAQSELQRFHADAIRYDNVYAKLLNYRFEGIILGIMGYYSKAGDVNMEAYHYGLERGETKNLGQSLTDAADCYLNAGNYQKSIECCKTGLRKSSNDAGNTTFYSLLTCAAYHLGDYVMVDYAYHNMLKNIETYGMGTLSLTSMAKSEACYLLSKGHIAGGMAIVDSLNKQEDSYLFCYRVYKNRGLLTKALNLLRQDFVYHNSKLTLFNSQLVSTINASWIKLNKTRENEQLQLSLTRMNLLNSQKKLEGMRQQEALQQIEADSKRLLLAKARLNARQHSYRQAQSHTKLQLLRVRNLRQQEMLSQQKQKALHTAAFMAALFLLSTFFVWMSRRQRHLRHREAEEVALLEEARKTAITERDKALDADRMKTAFIQNMSHEIRTPLNIIVGFSNILAEDENNELAPKDKETFSKSIISNSHQLSTLINDILDLSNLQNGNRPVQMQSLSLQAVCHDIIGPFFEHSPKITLQLDLPEEDLIFVSDYNLLRQVLDNYLSNALKYTEEGSVTLSCRADENHLNFAVTDTGCGVPEDKAEVIFEQFEKLDSFKQGIGLGLYLCKSLATFLRGRVWLDTSYKSGARFCLQIPYSKDDAQHEKLFQEPDAAGVTSPSSAMLRVGLSLLFLLSFGLHPAKAAYKFPFITPFSTQQRIFASARISIPTPRIRSANNSAMVSINAYGKQLDACLAKHDYVASAQVLMNIRQKAYRHNVKPIFFLYWRKVLWDKLDNKHYQDLFEEVNSFLKEAETDNVSSGIIDGYYLLASVYNHFHDWLNATSAMQTYLDKCKQYSYLHTNTLDSEIDLALFHFMLGLYGTSSHLLDQIQAGPEDGAFYLRKINLQLLNSYFEGTSSRIDPLYAERQNILRHVKGRQDLYYGGEVVYQLYHHHPYKAEIYADSLESSRPLFYLLHDEICHQKNDSLGELTYFEQFKEVELNHLSQLYGYVQKEANIAAGIDNLEANTRHLKMAQYKQALVLSKSKQALVLHQQQLIKLKGDRDQYALSVVNLRVQNSQLSINRNQSLQKAQQAKLDIGKFALDAERLHHNFYLVVSILLAISAVGAIYLFLRERRIKHHLHHGAEQLEKANQLILEERTRAEKGGHMKTVFIQNMSHEIRTPLNAIVGFAQLLAEDDGTFFSKEDKQDFARNISTNSDLLTTLVNDILHLSNLESGSYQVKKTEIDAGDMCQLAVESVQHRINGSIMLSAIHHDTHTILLSDRSRVQQVLINYLTNAIKHTSEGSITLDYSVEGDEITFSVTDTGEGVPEDKQPLLFQRYEMLDTSKSGHGLGLHICRVISENLGGRVWYDASYNDGARFCFSLPIGPE